jgi:hypothetical protein
MLEQACVGDQRRRDRLEATRREERLRLSPSSRPSNIQEDRKRPASCLFNLSSIFRIMGNRRRNARTGAEGQRRGVVRVLMN